MNRIAFLTTISYPSTLANRIHVREMCRAFINHGLQVSFFSENADKDNFLDYPSLTFYNQEGNLLKRAVSYVRSLKKLNECDVWYCREPRLLFLVLILSFMYRIKIPYVVFEIHDESRAFFDRLILILFRLNHKFVIIAITEELSTWLKNKYNYLENHILVLADGVSSEMFKVESQPDKDGHILYTGSLYAWKGVYTLVDAARLLPENDFIIVGGNDNDIKSLKKYANGISNVDIVGYVPHEEISIFYKGAAIVVLPNSSDHEMSRLYTSPLKLFEYMASGIPIVASNLPSLKEVLREDTVEFADPDNATSLSKAFKKVLNDYNKAMDKASLAKIEVKQFSWNQRVSKIMNHINI